VIWKVLLLVQEDTEEVDNECQKSEKDRSNTETIKKSINRSGSFVLEIGSWKEDSRSEIQKTIWLSLIHI